jgi:hypothetical protein
MRYVLPFSALVLSGLLAAGCASTPAPVPLPPQQAESSLVPPQVIEMDAETLEEFLGEVEKYVWLRRSVLAHIRAATAESSGEQVSARLRASTQAVVAYRRGKKRGNIFTKDAEAAIRRTLRREFSGPDGPGLIKGVQQGNPANEGNPSPANPTRDVKFPVALVVNGIYPDAAPFSSVPPSLLLKLPPLPDEVRYRFVGRALILRDTEANVILDFIPDVVPVPAPAPRTSK